MSLSYLEVSVARLVANVRAMGSLLSPDTRLIAVVKGNAYGHGLEQVVPALEPHVDGFQVDDIEELRALRKLTTARALVLGYVGLADIEEAVTLNAELAIYDLARLQAISAVATKAGRNARLHLKIDAALGRQGVLPTDVGEIAAAIAGLDGLELVSAYAHFANIEDTTDLGHAQLQLELLERTVAALRLAGWPNLEIHSSATSGVMTIESGSNLARVGLGLYGLYPSAALARQDSEAQLLPVLRWVSHLAQVKVLPPRHPVGYGLTFITPREMRIGIVPQGYADGYDRGLSNSGEVLVAGKRCAVIGRVAMNMFAIDLTPVPDAKAEDEVVLLGSQGDEEITSEELALRLGTINYEITTRISPLLPRVVV